MTHKNLLESLGWQRKGTRKSLEEVHKSIPIPKNMGFFRKMLAFSGPGYLVAVGYMDPGNWATDLAGGSRFGYTLLFVILLSNLFAMLLQHLSAKLGIVSGRDLAQACRDTFPKWANYILWIMAEVMITACDLAEVIGSAIALNLLFHIPLAMGVIITAADVLILLMLQQKGFRYLEALVITLVLTIVVCFGLEIIFAKPELFPLLAGFIPNPEIITNPEMLYIAVGILGATVMPHNLYLHSAVVQTRDYEETVAGKREAVKFSTIDSTFALFIAFFVNAAILIVAAAVFSTRGYGEVAEIEEAYKLLTPLLGVGAASFLFALALLASGQNSTITGTLAGQIIMEGFLNLRIRPWLRRIITRLVAIVPAIIVVILYGGTGLGRLLILSQVVLSMQLSFAVFPLVMFTSDKKKMGPFVNPPYIKYSAYTVAIIIALLNIWLIVNTFFS
ncbi:divalent metal cation transporter [Candidatus Roizmanbacteria bacterium RIFCSPLOWO2_12_FULL_40_12]|uniref:Divalent metal cation transporter MntH n=1 Tax=Candidatus Roizmanbacteria bacterium RIFCSPLOWO2_01_FULL_40_42 TaxID=1802066 RepID=A0A1F7J546_9BACT|nr:MAG: divalent metal cation transporter [Candidatus Roizmanbacteria bacterium RIFCSPHIGHO2_01_FULL_40_98]OGK28538.1 MAG: divalent metal cation transporter [Candidatus Roizmanbacteria bacterium RIFCSPHIGHO2_02_FULL_40_53]OGK30408.1 MAG: divalent metal cation transporter [Candidatus Roizmanbacteria bacterium RIFCSPHIGHO2_12_41_18]OGK36561.1 MAG: divalent metal cation transporter [Candidatus Roizmanbacteria bacterium RIFCSPHIGHO2_12_FULL_40_130]OGK50726.1 MAG: divalent metal cation transporter [